MRATLFTCTTAGSEVHSHVPSVPPKLTACTIVRPLQHAVCLCIRKACCTNAARSSSALEPIGRADAVLRHQMSAYGTYMLFGGLYVRFQGQSGHRATL
jgi:hypothetical protein